MAAQSSDREAEQSPLAVIRRLVGLRGSQARQFYDQATLYSRASTSREYFIRTLEALAVKHEPITVELVQKAIADLEAANIALANETEASPLQRVAAHLGLDRAGALAFISEVQEGLNLKLAGEETPEAALPAHRPYSLRVSHAAVAEALDHLAAQGLPLSAESVTDEVRRGPWFARRQEERAVAQARSEPAEAGRARERAEEAEVTRELEEVARWRWRRGRDELVSERIRRRSREPKPEASPPPEQTGARRQERIATGSERPRREEHERQPGTGRERRPEGLRKRPAQQEPGRPARSRHDRNSSQQKAETGRSGPPGSRQRGADNTGRADRQGSQGERRGSGARPADPSSRRPSKPISPRVPRRTGPTAGRIGSTSRAGRPQSDFQPHRRKRPQRPEEEREE